MSTGNSLSTLPATENIFDVNRLAALQRQAKAGDPAANKAVARQFEAFFVQMVMKSMRDATPRTGLFDSDATRMYESLLDQQLAQVIGGGNRGTGLAATIEAQLARRNQEPQSLGPLPLHPAAPSYRLPQERALPLRQDGTGAPPALLLPLKSLPVRPAAAVPPAPTIVPEASAAQRAFVARMLPAAAAVEQSTGIPAHFMVAQRCV